MSSMVFFDLLRARLFFEGLLNARVTAFRWLLVRVWTGVRHTGYLLLFVANVANQCGKMIRTARPLRPHYWGDTNVNPLSPLSPSPFSPSLSLRPLFLAPVACLFRLSIVFRPPFRSFQLWWRSWQCNKWALNLLCLSAWVGGHCLPAHRFFFYLWLSMHFDSSFIIILLSHISAPVNMTTATTRKKNNTSEPKLFDPELALALLARFQCHSFTLSFVKFCWIK